MTKPNKKIILWLKKKFQLVVYHGNSFDVIRKFRFNRFGFIMLLFGIFFILFAGLSVIVVYTPVKQLIPGYPDKETRTLIYENAIKTDSLLAEINKRDQYLKVISDMILNQVPIDEEFVVPVQNLSPEQMKSFNNPVLPRTKVEDNASYTLAKADVVPDLFPPIKGVIIATYNPATQHYGTDIASNGETMISAVLSGTVISSGFTIETGYTIIIQHQSELISVYKHCKMAFVKTGDPIETGQLIAVYGNSGENSSGPHLHFELWRKGQSLNPENYIDFQ